MRMEYICVYFCLHFLLSMSYSLQCTGLLPPWLNLFLGMLFFFDAIVNRIVFLICFSGSLLLVQRNATDFCILIEIRKFIIDTILLSRVHIQILQLAPKMPLIANLPSLPHRQVQDPILDHSLHFIVPSLQSPLPRTDPPQPFFCLTLTFFKSTVQLSLQNICQFGFI